MSLSKQEGPKGPHEEEAIEEHEEKPQEKKIRS
jgi:hypothetical protein